MAHLSLTVAPVLRRVAESLESPAAKQQATAPVPLRDAPPLERTAPQVLQHADAPQERTAVLEWKAAPVSEAAAPATLEAQRARPHATAVVGVAAIAAKRRAEQPALVRELAAEQWPDAAAAK